jgi:hypothetical protein
MGPETAAIYAGIENLSLYFETNVWHASVQVAVDDKGQHESSRLSAAAAKAFLSQPFSVSSDVHYSKACVFSPTVSQT